MCVYNYIIDLTFKRHLDPPPRRILLNIEAIRWYKSSISLLNTSRDFTIRLFCRASSLYPSSGRTPYSKISWSIEAARLGFRLFKSLQNMTGASAALFNFRAIRSLQQPADIGIMTLTHRIISLRVKHFTGRSGTEFHFRYIWIFRFYPRLHKSSCH